MACRCAERRIALQHAAGATLRGDVAAAAGNVSMVARTMIEDAAFAARARLSLLRATMGRGVQR
jgi:hypothetical protein